MSFSRILCFSCWLVCALAGTVRLDAAIPATWTNPFPAFHIAGNLYYVGSSELASYLVVTPQGNILINSDMEANVPLIRQSIESLGFRFSDTKILLISHAHYDHCGGSATIKKLTGARYEVMDADVSSVESGGKTDFQYHGDPSMYFSPAKVDRVLHDGDTVKLGSAVLTAHKTAGHTRGTTTWTIDEQENGRSLHVVIFGSTTVLSSYKLVGNRPYPQIATDFQHAFQVLESLPCDIFLGAHASSFDLAEKYRKLKAGQPDAFIDPAGYKEQIAGSRRDFEQALKRQQAAGQ